MSIFRKASKATARLRMALVGPSGSGKTFSALSVASGLGRRIAVIDTEHGSASKYAGKFAFDVVELASFDPRNYIETIQAAESEGFDVLIIDSLSHAWTGKGGALEQVDQATKRSRSNNTFTAWRDVTPLHNALVDAMIACRCHLIATMRTKVEYALEADQSTGKLTPKKIGMAPIQREGMDYEFDVVCDLDLEHNLIVGKTRFDTIDRRVIHKPGPAFGRMLAEWLSDGVPGDAENGNQSVPTPTATLPTEMVRQIQRLANRLNMTDFQLRSALARRGVTAIERLSTTDAQGLINQLEHHASKLEFAEMVGGPPTNGAEPVSGQPPVVGTPAQAEHASEASEAIEPESIESEPADDHSISPVTRQPKETPAKRGTNKRNKNETPTATETPISAEPATANI